MPPASSSRKAPHGTVGEAGYMLLAVIVMVAMVLIALAVAAPIVAKDLRRDKEVESEHRAEQHVRALRLYYRQFRTYPPSLDALEKSNNIRFLRQRYIDPLTGKGDWRLIHVGEQKTTVKGFFGEPLSGLQTSGIGSTAGLSSLGTPIGASSSGASSFGASSSGSSSFGASSFGSSSLGSSNPGTGAQGGGLGASAAGPGGAGSGATTIGATSGLAAGFAGATIGSSGSSSATSGATGFGGSTGSSGFGSGGVGQIMGVGSARTGESILTPNEQTTYDSWEFLYDPRIEQLYAKSNILGGGVATQSSSGFGHDATTALSGATGSTGSTGTTGSTGSTGATGFTGSMGSGFSPINRP